MVSYSLLTKRSAARELEALALKDRKRVVSRIRSLAFDPRPPRCEKLSGEEKYRIRQGDLAIVYEISDRDSTMTVVRIGHWRDVYREKRPGAAVGCVL